MSDVPPAGVVPPLAGEDAPVVRAVVAGHGQLAAGLVSAVAQITGQGGAFLPLSNAGYGREELEAVLRAALDGTGASLVFTDLPGGSWTFAARRVQRERPSLVVVTGVNLAMLLEHVFHEPLPVDAAARAAVEKGRSAMIIAGGGGGD